MAALQVSLHCLLVMANNLAVFAYENRTTVKCLNVFSKFKFHHKLPITHLTLVPGTMLVPELMPAHLFGKFEGLLALFACIAVLVRVSQFVFFEISLLSKHFTALTALVGDHFLLG